MNLNLIAYGLFLTITIYIIVVVGQICYRNGNTYVLSLVPGHQDLCTRINKILLTGYYLVNLGYTATTLIHWERITTLTAFIEILASRTGFIIVLLAILHYTNLFIITKYINKFI
ncbi:hypothetical protein [Flavobacterium psychrotrophum]|uniref:hypothetical protein n=1 Tax=Flavobacterium psychrotrophum TaxID=2294119 RepID=UPI000E3132E0|nr:hypothetical protein [Flavobacterium psychrotrophum]